MREVGGAGAERAPGSVAVGGAVVQEAAFVEVQGV